MIIIAGSFTNIARSPFRATVWLQQEASVAALVDDLQPFPPIVDAFKRAETASTDLLEAPLTPTGNNVIASWFSSPPNKPSRQIFDLLLCRYLDTRHIGWPSIQRTTYLIDWHKLPKPNQGCSVVTFVGPFIEVPMMSKAWAFGLIKLLLTVAKGLDRTNARHYVPSLPQASAQATPYWMQRLISSHGIRTPKLVLEPLS